MAKPIRWSFSRIDRYSRCPRSYAMQYIERRRGKANDAMRFGSFLHSVLEKLYKAAIADELVGKWDRDLMLEFARSEYASSGISGMDKFAEGIEMLDSWLVAHPTVDSYQVLAVEASFEIMINGSRVMGYIDRIDRLPGDVVKIIDYKSNRMLYSQDDLKNNLQLSIYAMAARCLYPWAKHVELEFDMLRHGCVQQTSRSTSELEVAAQYVQAMVESATTNETFEPRLHRLCAWCDHRSNCDAYQQALKDGGVEGQEVGGANIDELAAEREKVATVEKLAKDRKAELDKALIHNINSVGDFEAAGREYSMRTRTTNSYPLQATIDVFAELTPMDADDVRDSITAVQTQKINKLITKLRDDMPSGEIAMLRGQLSTVAKPRKTQFLSSKALEDE